MMGDDAISFKIARVDASGRTTGRRKIPRQARQFYFLAHTPGSLRKAASARISTEARSPSASFRQLH